MSQSDWRSEYPFVSRWLKLPDEMRMHYIDEGLGLRQLLVEKPQRSWPFMGIRLGRSIIARLHRDSDQTVV